MRWPLIGTRLQSGRFDPTLSEAVFEPYVRDVVVRIVGWKLPGRFGKYAVPSCGVDQ